MLAAAARAVPASQASRLAARARHSHHEAPKTPGPSSAANGSSTSTSNTSAHESGAEKPPGLLRRLRRWMFFHRDDTEQELFHLAVRDKIKREYGVTSADFKQPADGRDAGKKRDLEEQVFARLVLERIDEYEAEKEAARRHFEKNPACKSSYGKGGEVDKCSESSMPSQRVPTD